MNISKEQKERETKFKETLERVLRSRNDQRGRFCSLIGLKLRDAYRGVPGKESIDGMQPWVEYDFHAEEIHLNPYGGVHGGVIASLFDTGAGMGAMSLNSGYASTTALEVSYLRALRNADYLVHVDFTHVGHHLISASAKIVDCTTKEICATGHITFMMIAGDSTGLND